MYVSRSGIWLVFLLFALALSSLGQDAPTAASSQQPAPPAQPQPGVPHSNARVRPPLCWKTAGLSPDMMNQRWQFEESAKAKISEVCSEPTLSAQQKSDKIRQINAETEREFAQIVPADKLASFNACEAQRDRELAAHPGKIQQKKLGPCGGVIPDPALAPMSHEHPMSSPAQK